MEEDYTEVDKLGFADEAEGVDENGNQENSN